MFWSQFSTPGISYIENPDNLMKPHVHYSGNVSYYKNYTNITKEFVEENNIIEKIKSYFKKYGDNYTSYEIFLNDTGDLINIKDSTKFIYSNFYKEGIEGITFMSAKETSNIISIAEININLFTAGLEDNKLFLFLNTFKEKYSKFFESNKLFEDILCATVMDIGAELYDCSSYSLLSVESPSKNPDYPYINKQDKDGNTVMHIAAQLGQLPLLQALMLGLPDLTIKNNAGDTAQDIAMDRTCKIYLKNCLPLSYARYNKTELMKNWLQSNKSRNSEIKILSYPQIKIIEFHNMDWQKGVEIFDPLSVAAFKGHSEFVDLMLQQSTGLPVKNALISSEKYPSAPPFYSTPGQCSIPCNFEPEVAQKVKAYEKDLITNKAYSNSLKSANSPVVFGASENNTQNTTPITEIENKMSSMEIKEAPLFN